jgi:hypothetical protein
MKNNIDNKNEWSDNFNYYATKYLYYIICFYSLSERALFDLLLVVSVNNFNGCFTI